MLQTDKIMTKLFQSETGNKRYMDAYEAYKGIRSSFNASEQSKASQYSKNASENPSSINERSKNRKTNGVSKTLFGNMNTRASFERGLTTNSSPTGSMKTIKPTNSRHTSFLRSGLGLNMSAPINPEQLDPGYLGPGHPCSGDLDNPVFGKRAPSIPEFMLKEGSILEIEPSEGFDIENPGHPGYLDPAIISSALKNSMKE
jgi:hypothetical protein